MSRSIALIVGYLFASSVGAVSQELKLNPPHVLIGCEPVTFSMSGGQPPYTVALSKMDTPFTPDIILQTTSDTSFPWCLPNLQERQYNMMVSDSIGEVVFIGPISVQVGPSTTTITATTIETIIQEPSATPGGTTDAAGGTSTTHISSSARIGIATGCMAIAALLLAALLFLFCMRRMRDSARRTDNNETSHHSDDEHGGGITGDGVEKDALVAPRAVARGTNYDASAPSSAPACAPFRRYDPSPLAGMPACDVSYASQARPSSRVSAPRIAANGQSLRTSMLPQPDGPAGPWEHRRLMAGSRASVATRATQDSCSGHGSTTQVY